MPQPPAVTAALVAGEEVRHDAVREMTEERMVVVRL